MKSTRRGFLGTLAAAVATPAVIKSVVDPKPLDLVTMRESYSKPAAFVWEKGMRTRLISQYDIDHNVMITRFDVLYGIGTLNPDLSCKIVG